MIITRRTIEVARQEGIPFSIHMADGREFLIRSADDVRAGPRHVVVFDNNMNPRILPYLTMTGIDYLKGGEEAKARRKK
jgi:hypothetical protein